MSTVGVPGPGELLLERDSELQAVSRLLANAGAGRGRLLVVEGQAGLGKSTLIDQLEALAISDGFVVLRAAGRELEQALGWGVARALFEPWLLARPLGDREDLLAGPASSASLLLGPEGEVGELPASEVSFGILHGLFWLTARIAESQPTLLVVDDAHWADEPSLRLLAYLLGRIRDQRVGLLVAARSGEPGAGGVLTQLSAERDVAVCELAPLSATAVRTLVRARLPPAEESFCARCWELTAGNPLGVREVLAAIVEESAEVTEPDLDAVAERAARALSRSVLRRLAALPPDARALADAVAVFEGGVELARAAALAGLEPAAALAAADELSRVDILAAEDPLSFTHPLLRAAVYGALSRRRKAHMHRRAAAVLLAAHGPSEQIAAHLLEVPPAADGEVAAALRAAAGRAMAHGVPASAARYLERAIREPASDADRAAMLAELGRAEASFAPHRAIEHLGAAIGIAAEPRQRATLALELGRAMHDAGRPEDACAAFERGIVELGDDGGELATELEAWYLTSAVLVPERAPDAHRRTEAITARSASTPAARLLASKSLIMRMYEGQPHQPLAELALELYGNGRLIEEGGLTSQSLGHVAVALSYSDQYAAAEEAINRGRDEAQRIGWLTWFAAATQLRARQRLWTGTIPDAVADATTAVEIFSSGQQMYLPASTYCLARALIESDQDDEADRLLATVEPDAPPTGMFAAWAHEARGRLAAATGGWNLALEQFLACGERAQSVLVRNPSMFHWRSEAGLAALRLGQRELARQLIDEETALAERFGAPRAIAVARRAEALLDRGEAAEQGLRCAADLFCDCGARVELAHTLVELGATIRRAGRPSDARDPLREAIRVAEGIGALRAARHAREELTRAGGRAPAQRNRGDELTPSERRVAELAADGRTNREIANELFVTVKAVEWHLGNSYRKLDIRGRSALGRALGERR